MIKKLYGIHNGHAYVDLGLRDGHGNRILFATMNVGAESETDYGDFFAWGETQKRYTSINGGTINGGSFTWANCPFHSGSNEITGWSKYIPANKARYWSGEGDPDNKLTLDAEDDVAHIQWGGLWRMPDRAELEMLKNECDNGWQENHKGSGKGGHLVTGPSGASILLPATGSCYVSEHFEDSGFCCYWSRSLDAYNPGNAWSLFLSFRYIRNDTWLMGPCNRLYGRSVRPVLVLPE